MSSELHKILKKEELTKDDLVSLISAGNEENEIIFNHAGRVRELHLGKKVHLRGLIEFSNICSKNCFYCGIRCANKNVPRYEATEKEIVGAAKHAQDNGFGSVALQSGERSDKKFIKKIDRVLQRIKQQSGGKMGITLSAGEQTEDVYRMWFESGAHRYLLRIEMSDPGLYKKFHPGDNLHDFNKRTECLSMLRKTGYQTGSGMLIGLPFQTPEHLARDLLFLKENDIDMAGMGPYIEHPETPLYKYREVLLSKKERFYLGIKMVAALRILMKDINIAATTAMQTLHPEVQQKALIAGANIVMPNITPAKYRENYFLYEGKSGVHFNLEEVKSVTEERIRSAGFEPGYNEWGDSLRFEKRKNRQRC